MVSFWIRWVPDQEAAKIGLLVASKGVGSGISKSVPNRIESLELNLTFFVRQSAKMGLENIG